MSEWKYKLPGPRRKLVQIVRTNWDMDFQLIGSTPCIYIGMA